MKKHIYLPPGTEVEVIRIENKQARKKVMPYAKALELKSNDKVKYIIYQLGFSEFKIK